jgi:hypothetical protein
MRAHVWLFYRLREVAAITYDATRLALRRR